MKSNSPTAWNPARLDVRAFAQSQGQLEQETPLAHFLRLLDDMHPAGESLHPKVIAWNVSGEIRPAPAGAEPSVWMHMRCQVELPQTCQRCLGPVDTAIEVDRWFRFVADEAAAAAEDEACEEDVLAMEPRPNLLELLEDELLMALPLVPMHEVCPTSGVIPSGGDGSESEPGDGRERKNPFAALAKLKK